MQLTRVQSTLSDCVTGLPSEYLNTIILCGIGYQLIGETNIARCFPEAAENDKCNETSAASRLFNSNNKEKIITILTNFYGQGINCFASSETLQDYQNQSNESTESLISRNSRLLQQIMPTFHTIRTMLTSNRVLRLLYNFLHSSRTGISRDLFALQISEASMRIPEGKQYPNSTGNKHRYSSYKHDLSYLVIGLNSDAVSGLLKLASFFYVYKN
ncbi:unnamed protein product [Mytilus edulis]|uniref:Uncharacterized protein n=1 Tax=Mytilus edulis TaxID=6550 RepID=A0A8S3SFX7_MYTED|nr:unnamed protein product [Mytilus edulis]